MAAKCPLCERHPEPHSDLCYLHDLAAKNIENAYSAWNKAYDGKLDKGDYYARIAPLPETGRFAKEVIHYLRSKGASK
jgi:hypothetical protein